MVRRFTPEEKKIFLRPGYWIAVVLIIAVWIWAFKLYFERYEYLHPEITWAVPGTDNKTVPVRGVLLWKERLVNANISGVVTYPQGTGPVRVSRGSVVARISSGGTVRDIKAYQQGYFVAAVDGKEGTWRYSEIWPESSAPPKLMPIKKMKDGFVAGSGQAVGKLIEQPQELRFVGFAKDVGDISEQLKNKKLRVKMDGVDTISVADVRVALPVGGKVKMYLTIPWFPPELLMSRSYTLTVDAGRTDGSVVPESAVIRSDKEIGIYMVKGSRVVYKKIEGRSIAAGIFLVTKGISVGDAVVEDASKAREGRIQLW